MGYRKRLAKAERNSVARAKGHYPYHLDIMGEAKGGSKVGPGMKRAAKRMEDARERNHDAAKRHDPIWKNRPKTRQQLRAIARADQTRVTPAEAARRAMKERNMSARRKKGLVFKMEE